MFQLWVSALLEMPQVLARFNFFFAFLFTFYASIAFNSSKDLLSAAPAFALAAWNDSPAFAFAKLPQSLSPSDSFCDITLLAVCAVPGPFLFSSFTLYQNPNIFSYVLFILSKIPKYNQIRLQFTDGVLGFWGFGVLGNIYNYFWS